MTLIQDICDYVESETDIVLIPMVTWPRKPNTIHETDHEQFQTGTPMHHKSFNILYHGVEKDDLVDALSEIRKVLVDDFSTLDVGDSIRDVSTLIGTWDAWTERTHSSFKVALVNGIYVGRLLDTSTSETGLTVNCTFSAPYKWVATDDWFEISIQRVSGSTTFPTPVLYLKVGTTNVIQLSFTKDEIYSRVGVGDVKVATITEGEPFTVRVTYATDTTATYTITQSGRAAQTTTAQIVSTNSFATANITTLQFATGQTLVCDCYVYDIKASWLPYTGLISAQSNPHATHLGIWNNRDAYSIDFDVYY